MRRGQGPADAALLTERAAFAANSPSTGVPASAQLQENAYAWPAPWGGKQVQPLPLGRRGKSLDVGFARPKQGDDEGCRFGRSGDQIARNAFCSGDSTREFGTPVDGSPVGGISALAQQRRPPGGSPLGSPFGVPRCQRSGWRFGGLPAQQGGGVFTLQGSGFKRPADQAVFVDDEFRQAERLAPGSVRPSPASAGNSSGSRTLVDAFGSSTARLVTSPATSAVAVEPASANTAVASVDILVAGEAGSALAGMLADGGEDEDNIMGEDVEMHVDDKENQLPLHSTLQANSIHPYAALPASAEGVSAVQRDVLGDVDVEVPQEFQDHPFSDIESSSGGSDFQTENLAEHLAERIAENADDMYVFDVYVDPANLQ